MKNILDDGRMDGWTEVKLYTPPPEELGYNKRKQLPKYLKHIYLADETHRIYM